MALNIRRKLAKRIKELRKLRGYTQDRLAELSKIDYKYIQKIEGKDPPAVKIDTIARLAKALRVKAAELLDFK